MPIFELGYRRWDGGYRPQAARWWAIARTGIKLAWRSKLLRRLIFLSWAPLLYFGPVFFAVGYVTDPSNSEAAVRGWRAFLASLVGQDLTLELMADPESARGSVWAMIYAFYFSYSSAILVLLVTTLVGPPLISQDVRTRAFLIYFSKPISGVEYLLGQGRDADGVHLHGDAVPGVVPVLPEASSSPRPSARSPTRSSSPSRSRCAPWPSRSPRPW